MEQVTIIFCVRGDQVLLAPKKKKVGKGKLNGPGGKRKSEDANMRACAEREFAEETLATLDPENLEYAAWMEFQVEGEKIFECFIYLLRKWEGVPQETDEWGQPKWFPIDALPVTDMLPADALWVPEVLRGRKQTKGFVNYSADFQTILDHGFVQANELPSES